MKRKSLDIFVTLKKPCNKSISDFNRLFKFSTHLLKMFNGLINGWLEVCKKKINKTSNHNNNIKHNTFIRNTNGKLKNSRVSRKISRLRLHHFFSAIGKANTLMSPKPKTLLREGVSKNTLL